VDQRANQVEANRLIDDIKSAGTVTSSRRRATQKNVMNSTAKCVVSNPMTMQLTESRICFLFKYHQTHDSQ